MELTAAPTSAVLWEEARTNDLATRFGLSYRVLHGLIAFDLNSLRDAFWNPSEENDAKIADAVERERRRGEILMDS